MRIKETVNKEKNEVWYLKFWVRDKLSIYCSRTEKFNVRLYCHRVGFWTEGNKKYLLGLIRIKGDKESKERFIEDLKKDTGLERILRYEDSFIALTSLPIKKSKELVQQEYFDQKLIYISPVIIDNDSKEYWEVASFNREAIIALKKANEDLFKVYEGEILEFGKKKINDKWIFQISDLWKNWEKINFLKGKK